MLLSQCYKAEQSKWGSGSVDSLWIFFKKFCVCVCVCVRGGRGCANQPQYHHLANIGAEEIKIRKVTEQFHQDNYATIN